MGRLVERIGSCALALAAIAACTTAKTSSAPPPDVALHVPTIASSARPAVTVRPDVQPDVPDATSWRDERVVERLVAECRWRPTNLDRARDYTHNPLSCVLDQRPLTDHPCFEAYERECKPACTKTCSSCASRCVDTCDKCKLECTDDACRRTCAQTTADCRQACADEAAQCQVTTCNSGYLTCFQTLQAELRRPGCKTACTAAYRCSQTCSAGRSQEECAANCRRVFGIKCADRYFEYCAGGGS